MQDPQARITIRTKGEYFTQESQAAITGRLTNENNRSNFILIHVIEAMEYKPMTVSKSDVIAVESC
jgi:hypothetical protein